MGVALRDGLFRQGWSSWLIARKLFTWPPWHSFSRWAGFASAEEPGTNIPLKRVVMFSSGVAFFEQRGGRGECHGGPEVQRRDINDLLKSMVLQDEGGGKISTVSYGSKDPITRTLQTFAIDLTQTRRWPDL